MPHLEEDLIEGLRLRLSNGKLQMTRKFEARALTGTASERLAQALTLTSVGTAHTGVNLPVDGETFTVGGVTLYANDFDVELLTRRINVASMSPGTARARRKSARRLSSGRQTSTGPTCNYHTPHAHAFRFLMTRHPQERRARTRKP
jgi:hypothetical protein